MDTPKPTLAEVIDELRTELNNDPDLAALLGRSLQSAREIGHAKLDLDLFEALDWPEDLDEYYQYLNVFGRLIPQQSEDPAWTQPDTDEQQEVYDRLCHFYWLIDQEVGPEEKIVQNNEFFKNWLIKYADAWGSFLDTTESFNQDILDSFIKNSPKYRVKEESMFMGPDGKLIPNAPSGWLTFNQFFARELNPGLRPIASLTDNSVIVSPADCTYRNSFRIDADSSIEEIAIKKTHKFANVKDLLKDSPYADAFANGTFAHYFLSPYSYHRFHMPVAGLLRECRRVAGLVYLDVNVTGRQFDAPDGAKDAYEFSQARGIVIIDTTGSPYGDVGLVGVVPIGMCQISSVNMTAAVGNNMSKGEEFGYFLFGGSDIIVLLQEQANPTIYTGKDYHHYGTRIATCNI